MPEAPTILQLILTALAALLVAGGVGIAVAKRRRGAAGLQAAGLGLALVAQMLHAAGRGDWLPLQDNFDALLWLAILTGVFTLYLRRRETVPRIDWIAGPIVVLLLLGAALFGRARPHKYRESLWWFTHGITAYGSGIFFALAACAGVLYLILRSKLRARPTEFTAPPDAGFGSLEKLERLNYVAVTIGFALLSVAIVSGLMPAFAHPTTLGKHWYLQPKVLLSFGSYVVYAVVLHSPINPAIRGKKTAILSIAGFVLVLGTLVALQLLGPRKA